jgi:peptide/nickel transport system substrate-binding protein
MNLKGAQLVKVSSERSLAKRSLAPMLVLLGLMLLAACSKTKEVPVTRVVIETRVKVTVQTVIQRVQVTPTPEFTVVEAPHLVICMGQEPETLYRYGGSSLAQTSIFEAIYDGPIDSNSFGFQPVILEKLPSLADGDAIVKQVTVQAGDLVVDADDTPVTLERGARVRPAGCYNSQCAVEFDGDPITMDKLVVAYTLKAGILWSDGEPLTAHDSVYAFELAQDPYTPANKYVIDRSASYEAIDDYTVVWTSLPGYTTLPLDPLSYSKASYATNFWPPLPKHAWGHLSALELLEAEQSTRKPPGWGPYLIEIWGPGTHIDLFKNKNYWRADEGLPKFYFLTFRFMGQDTNDNIAALLSGECDIVDQTAQLDDQAALLLALQARGQLNAAFSTGRVWEHADFGVVPFESYARPDFFGDVRTRQAIAMCMDRQAIVDQVTFGQSVVMHTYVPPQHPLYNPDARQYPFDPQAGSALLEEVGWIDDDGKPQTPRIAQGVEGVPDGTPLEFKYGTTDAPQRQQVVQILQDSLAECGIKIDPDYLTYGTYWGEPSDPIFGRHFDMVQFAWLSDVEPACLQYTSGEITGPPEAGYCGWGCANVTGWNDPGYDAACNVALQSFPGTPQYERFHREAQRIFAEQLPIVPLYLRLKVAAARPDMRGFIMDPTARSEMWNIEEFGY